MLSYFFIKFHLFALLFFTKKLLIFISFIGIIVLVIISWICKKFAISEEDNLVRDFRKETNTFIDPEKQIKHEESEKEWELER